MGYVSQWGGMDVGTGMLFAAESVDGLVHQLGGLRLRAECSLVPTHQYSYAYINQQSTLDDDNNIQDDEKRSVKCPVGTAVATSSGGKELQQQYDTILHTTPPFYNYPPSITPELKEVLGILDIDSDDDIHSWSKELLSSCYRQSFKVAFDNNTNNDTDIQNSFISNSLRIFGLNNKQHMRKTGKRVALPLLGAGCRAFPKDIALEVAAIESASWLSTSSDTSEQENTDEDEMDVVAFGLLEEDDAHHLSDRLEKELRVHQQPTPSP